MLVCLSGSEVESAILAMLKPMRIAECAAATGCFAWTARQIRVLEPGGNRDTACCAIDAIPSGHKLSSVSKCQSCTEALGLELELEPIPMAEASGAGRLQCKILPA